MNYQKKIPVELEQLYKQKFGYAPWDYSYYAFPYVFGSTAGPHGGMGGQAMSTFTIECYYFEEKDYTLVFCDGEYDLIEGTIKPHDSLHRINWKRVRVTPKENVSDIKKIEPIQLSLLQNPKNPE